MTKDVPDNCIVAGRPAELVKRIVFDREVGLNTPEDESAKILKELDACLQVEGPERAKEKFSSLLSFPNITGFSVSQLLEDSVLNSCALSNNHRVLILGSKPGSKILRDVNVVFSANGSLSNWQGAFDDDVVKIAVWGSLGINILEDIIRSGVDEIFCLGSEPKVFEGKKGLITQYGSRARYNVLSFFERRELVQEVVNRDGPIISEKFFELNSQHKFNLIKLAVDFLKNPSDTMEGNYDWPLPLRPSAGVFALIVAIARFGKESSYVVAGIGLSDRYKYQDVSGEVEDKTTLQIQKRIDFFGLDAHVESDLEILRILSKDYDISTTEKELAKALSIPFLQP